MKKITQKPNYLKPGKILKENLKLFIYTKAEKIYHWQTYSIVSIKGSPSSRRKIIPGSNLDLQKENQEWQI